jgi:hypothetical protein
MTAQVDALSQCMEVDINSVLGTVTILSQYNYIVKGTYVCTVG